MRIDWIEVEYGPVLSRITGGTQRGIKQAEKAFTGIVFVQKERGKQPEKVEVCVIDDEGRFQSGLVPRMKRLLKEKKIEVRMTPHPDHPDYDPTNDYRQIEVPELAGVTLRDYQVRAIKTALARGRGIIQAGTGAGKTEIAIAMVRWYLIQYPTFNVLLVVNTDRLLHQTLGRFRDRGFSEEEIGGYGGGLKQSDRPVTVAIDRTLTVGLKRGSKAVTALLSRQNGVIWDEAHHLKAPGWGEAGLLCPAGYRFGLSATPFADMDNPTVEELQVMGMTGPIIYRMPSWVLIQRGILAEPVIRPYQIDAINLPLPGEVPLKLAAGIRDWHILYEQGVRSNHLRNLAIVSAAKNFYDKGCSVVIFVQHERHGRRLLQHFIDEGYEDAIMCKGAKEVLVNSYGTIHKEKWELEKLVNHINENSISIATPFLDEGVDISGINVIVYAAGGKHPRQLLQRLGRGMRLKEGSSIGNRCIVIDFVDNTHWVLRSQSLKRLKTYRDAQLKVEPVTGVSMNVPIEVSKRWRREN